MEELQRFIGRMGIPEGILNDICRNTKIIIKSDDRTSYSYFGQVMLEISATLLARLFPNITVEVGACTAVHLHTDQELQNHLQQIILDSSIWHERNQESISEYYFVVGNTPVKDNAVYIDADGWLAYVGVNPSGHSDKSDNFIPIGAAVSACLGSAELFKRIYRGYISKKLNLIEEGLWFNTLTYDESNINTPVTCLKLDGVTLFGCGSVGSSLLYVLGFMPDVSGDIDIVDRDPKVDINNLQRYSMLKLSDVQRYSGVSKSRWVAEKIKRSLPKLNVRAWDGENGKVNKYLDLKPLKPGIKIAISAVDNLEARIEIADALAKRTINAGTGDSTLTITRHGFANGRACLACEHIVNEPDVSWFNHVSSVTGIPVDRVAYLLQGHSLLEQRDINIMISKGFIEYGQASGLENTDLQSLVNRKLYAAINIQVQKEEKPITTAFVSTMAGALLCGELVKEACGLQSSWDKNKYRTDLLSLPSLFTYYAIKDDKQRCVCNNQFRIIKYKELWGEVV